METTVYVIETSDGSHFRFYCVYAKKEDAEERALILENIYAHVMVTPYSLL